MLFTLFTIDFFFLKRGAVVFVKKEKIEMYSPTTGSHVAKYFEKANYLLPESDSEL
jgi:hypothetical protein